MNAQTQDDDKRSAVVGTWRASSGEVKDRVPPGAGRLSAVLDSLVISIEEVVGGGVIGSVLVLDEAGLRLQNGAAPHLPVDYCNAIDGLPVGPKAGSCGTAVFRRERVIVSDIAHDPLWDDYRMLARRNGLAACWSTPIVSRDGRVLGTFAMYHPSPRRPRASELALVDIFARTAAAVIERTHGDVLREQAVHAAGAARADAEAARADLQWLLDAIGALNSRLSYDDGFEYLARRAVPRLADIAVVDIFEHGRVARRFAVCDDPDLADALLQLRAVPNGSGASELTMAHAGRPEIRAIDLSGFADRHVDPELVRVLRAIDAREMMVVPLVARKETLGTLSLVVAGQRRCDQQTLALATGLAWRAALAIDNARLLAVREQSVTNLQHGLLPPGLPVVAGLDVSGDYQPVSEDLLVGGDFYDFFAVDGGWIFMIGDICGKGAAAASMTSLVRHTARALARIGVDIADVVRQVNSSMIDLADEEKFVTMIMGFVSLGAHGASVRLVSAGHPPALVISPDGVVPHGGGGTLLGQFDDVTLTDEAFTLIEGASLVLHTDGLFEARTASGEQYGQDRLAATAATLAGRPSAEIATGLTRAVLGFADAQTVDDIAVLVLTPRA